MVAAVRVHKHGGPEVLTFEDVEIPAPGQGQVRIKQHACGINFIDTYFRMGAYPSPVGLPFTPGQNPLVRRLYVILKRRAARMADHIISVCDAMTDEAAAAGLAPREKFTTVYSRMEVERFVHMTDSPAAAPMALRACWNTRASGLPAPTSPLTVTDSKYGSRPAVVSLVRCTSGAPLVSRARR